jgi:hypothetical protein
MAHYVISYSSEKSNYLSQLEWKQNDFLFFWQLIIEKYATHIYFNDGWEYSSGCVYEMLLVFKNNKIPKDIYTHVITPIEAIEKIKKAIEYIESINHKCDLLQQTVKEIEYGFAGSLE